MIYLEEKYLNTVKKILSEYKNRIDKVYVFGSRTREKHKKYSDLDLAIKFITGTDQNTLLFIKAAFENSELPIEVDVVDLDEISGEFKNAIAKSLIEINMI